MVLSLKLRLFAVPKSVELMFSSLIPNSSETNVARVKIAISSKHCFFDHQNPGALTATTFNAPRILFTTRAVNASPSISSAMINNASSLFSCHF